MGFSGGFKFCLHQLDMAHTCGFVVKRRKRLIKDKGQFGKVCPVFDRIIIPYALIHYPARHHPYPINMPVSCSVSVRPSTVLSFDNNNDSTVALNLFLCSPFYFPPLQICKFFFSIYLFLKLTFYLFGHYHNYLYLLGSGGRIADIKGFKKKKKGLLIVLF